ncbi:hypothetical protein THAOC_31651, partial [Thalassiosira oceanica]
MGSKSTISSGSAKLTLLRTLGSLPRWRVWPSARLRPAPHTQYSLGGAGPNLTEVLGRVGKTDIGEKQRQQAQGRTMASRRATRSNPPLKGLGTMQAPFQVLAATAWLLSAFGLANAVAPTRTFAFSSGVDAIDAAYELALREMSGLSGARHGKGGHFLAGAGWPSLWTRDTSYAVELSAGLVFPKISEES